MERAKRISLMVLFWALFLVGCTNENSTQSKQLTYDEAVHLFKQYAQKENVFGKYDICFLYEPGNALWNRSYAKHPKYPELLKECDLKGRDFYVFFVFGPPGLRGPEDIVFVDKNEKRVIGRFLQEQFTANPVDNMEAMQDCNLPVQSGYGQSVEVAIQFLLDTGFYTSETEVSLIYDPDNDWGKETVSRNQVKIPQSVQQMDCDILEFGKPTIICGNEALVFINQKDKKVVGTLYDKRRFESNP